MSILESIILGLIQGLTEFLPISSTGHLTLAGKLMKIISEENPERWTSFIAVIQLGTLLAVVIYFWKDLYHILREFLQFNWFNKTKFVDQSLNSKMGWYLVIGTIPVVIIGLAFKDIIESVFTKDLFVISISLIVIAIFMWIAERRGKFNRELKDIKWSDALLIGFAQALALIPGSSRSGTTITAGLFLGLNRETAARFSFILSIPAVAASGLLQFYQALKFIDKDGLVALLTATIISSIIGYISINYLIKYLKKKTTFVFIIYRICLGLLIIISLLFGIIKP